MSHRNARLTFHGRLLIVERVRSGQPVSHVAKAMGVSRQCAHRWIRRFDIEGEVGLFDRSSRPHNSPLQTTPELEEKVLGAEERQLALEEELYASLRERIASEAAGIRSAARAVASLQPGFT